MGTNTKAAQASSFPKENKLPEKNKYLPEGGVFGVTTVWWREEMSPF